MNKKLLVLTIIMLFVTLGLSVTSLEAAKSNGDFNLDEFLDSNNFEVGSNVQSALETYQDRSLYGFEKFYKTTSYTSYAHDYTVNSDSSLTIDKGKTLYLLPNYVVDKTKDFSLSMSYSQHGNNDGYYLIFNEQSEFNQTPGSVSGTSSYSTGIPNNNYNTFEHKYANSGTNVIGSKKANQYMYNYNHVDFNYVSATNKMQVSECTLPNYKNDDVNCAASDAKFTVTNEFDVPTNFVDTFMAMRLDVNGWDYDNVDKTFYDNIKIDGNFKGANVISIPKETTGVVQGSSIEKVVEAIDPTYSEVIDYVVTKKDEKLTAQDVSSDGGYSTNAKIGEKFTLVFKKRASDGSMVTFKEANIEITDMTDATIVTQDVSEFRNQAAKTEDQLNQKLLLEVFDGDGTAITNYNADYGNYNFSDPQVGVYPITYSAKGANNNVVSRTATYTVIENNAVISSTTANVKKAEAPKTDSEIMTLLDVKAVDGDFTTILPVEIVDLGGYNESNPQIGTYDIIFKTTGSNGNVIREAGTLRVIENDAIITSNDINVKRSDAPNNEFEFMSMGSVKAIDGDGTDISNQIVYDDLGGYNLTDPQVATYIVKYHVIGSNGVRVDHQTIIQILENDAEIKTKSSSVSVAQAPKTEAELISSILVSATDGNGNDIKANVILKNNTNYNYTSPIVGSYNITLAVTGSNGIEVTSSSRLTVFDGSATITSDDSQKIKRSEAPKTDQEIITALNVKAFEHDSTPISADKVYIINDQGYNENSPEKGDYEITFGVLASDGTEAKTSSILHIVENDAIFVTVNDITTTRSNAPTNQSEFISKSGLVINDGDGSDITSSVQFLNLNGYIFPNPKVGVYVIELGVRGENGVLVKQNMTITVTENDATILGNDYETKQITAPVNDEELKTVNNVSALDGDGIPINKSDIIISNYDGYEFATKSPGTYNIEYSVIGKNGTIVKKTFVLKVLINDATISSSETYTSNRSEAPKTKNQMLTQFNVVAYDENNNRIPNNKILITDLGGYEYNNPKVGVYNIVFTTSGTNGVVVTTTTQYTITENDATLSSTRADVRVLYAPKTDLDILKAINVKAIDGDGKAINLSEVRLTNKGTYDLAAPKVGSYTIEFEVTGVNGAIVKSSQILNIIENDAELTALDPTIKKLNEAPKTEAELKTATEVGAVDGDGSAIETSKIQVLSLGGYSYENPVVGEYKVVYGVAGKNTITIYKAITLEITYDDLVITANDATVKRSQAPKTDKGIDQLLGLEIIDGDNTSVNVYDANYDSYNFTTPQVKVYNVKYSATGVNGVLVEKVVKLTVLEDDAKISSVDETVVLKDAPVDDASLKTLLSVDAVDGNGTNIKDQVTVKDTGSYSYTSPAVGTYNITFAVTGVNGVEVTKVSKLIVLINDAVLTGSDVNNIQRQNAPRSDTSFATAANVVATDGDGTDITDQVVYYDIGGYSAVDPQPGTFIIKYYVIGANGNRVDHQSSLTVIENNAVINTKGASVNNLDAPKTEQEMIDLLVVSAIDGDGTDIKPSVTISQAPNYDYTDPQVGNYFITFSVVGKNGNSVTKTANLKVTLGSAGITSIDNETKRVTAPKNEEELKTFLQVSAKESNGDPIESNKILVKGLNQYDYSNPVAGEFTITFSVIGGDGNEVTSDSLMTIIENDAVFVTAEDFTVKVSEAPKTNLEFNDYSNLYIEDGNGTDITDGAYNVDTGGYDSNNPKTGVYDTTIGVVGTNGTIVTDVIRMTIIDNDAVISGENKSVKQSEAPKNDTEMKTLMNVTALDGNGTQIDPANITVNIGTFNYMNPQVGEYTISFSTTGINGTTVTSSYILTVTPSDATITADLSKEVFRSEAPTSKTQLFSLLNVSATDSNGEVISNSKIFVQDFDGYTYNNPQVGNYNIVFRTVGISGNAVSVTSNLIVKENNATIISSDYKSKRDVAPKSEAELINFMNASATDGDGTTSLSVSVKSISGYSYTAPVTGTYEITFTTTGVNGNVVEKKNTLSIIENDAVLVVNDASINRLGAPKTQEDMLALFDKTATDGDGTDITNSILIENVSNYSYANPKTNTYIIDFSVAGKNGVKVEKSAKLTVIAENAVITGVEETVTVKVAQAPKTSTEQKALFEALAIDDGGIGKDISNTFRITYNNDYNIGNPVPGSYVFSFYVIGENGVEVQKDFNLIVIQNDATIKANNAKVKRISAPKTDAEIISVLNTNAIEGDGITDLTNSVVIEDYNNYNKANPQVGKYNIILAVTGENGIKKTTTAILEVIENDATISSINEKSPLATAPKTEAEIKTLLKASATDGDTTTSLTNDIFISNLNGYSYVSPKVGTYNIQFSVIGSNGTKVNTTSKLEITYNDAQISVRNVSKNIAVAPQTEEEIINLMVIKAVDSDGVSSIKNKVVIKDLGGYDFNNPLEQDYNITFAVTGLSNNEVTDTKKLTIFNGEVVITTQQDVVKRSTAPKTQADLLNSLNASALDADGVTDLTSSITIPDPEGLGGYDYNNPLPGSYNMTLVVVSELKARTVVTTKNTEFVVLENDPIYNIQNSNASVLLEDAPKSDQDILTLTKTKVIDGNGNDITGNVIISDYNGYDINNPKIGTYKMQYSVTGANGIVITDNVTLFVHYVNATISSSDAIVEYNKAPKNDKELIKLLNVQAVDGDSTTSLNANVVIDSYGSYDYNNVIAGTYSIRLKVTGTNGVDIYTTSNLTIKEENTSTFIKQTGGSIELLLVGAVLIMLIIVLFIKKKTTEERA